jgi:DNA-binding NtrC family response regulator
MDKIKLLLVDDEAEFVKALSERLKMRDIGSEIALDGETALEMVEGEVPDVMVLDLRMPGLDGLEVLKKVKASFPKVQVIVLTGHGSDKDEENARALGAFEYLRKPVDLDKLLKTIKKAHSWLQDSMSAAAFAEAGDFETAKRLGGGDKGPKSRD